MKMTYKTKTMQQDENDMMTKKEAKDITGQK